MISVELPTNVKSSYFQDSSFLAILCKYASVLLLHLRSETHAELHRQLSLCTWPDSYPSWPTLGPKGIPGDRAVNTQRSTSCASRQTAFVHSVSIWGNNRGRSRPSFVQLVPPLGRKSKPQRKAPRQSPLRIRKSARVLHLLRRRLLAAEVQNEMILRRRRI